MKLRTLTALLGLLASTSSVMAVETWTHTVGQFLDGTNSATTLAKDGAAYSTTGGGGGQTGTLVSALLCSYGGEYGVVTSAEGTTCSTAPAPQHSTDNVTTTDMILLRFSSAVTLAQFTIGWNGTDNVDTSSTTYGVQGAGSDVSVLAYKGTSDPAPIGGLSTAGLLTNSWKVIGNYADVGTGSNVQNVTTTESSSWWLISAYNTAFNVVGAETPNGAPSAPSSSTTKDYFKLVSVAGTLATTPPPNPNGVPEPGSLALFGLGLFGLVYGRRRKAA